MTDLARVAQGGDARRALVLHERQLVVDLVGLTLNHGLFVVHAASSLAEAEQLLATWAPHLAVVDVDHPDGPDLLARLGASNPLGPASTPVLGLTRMPGLNAKLRAFELGVDDIVSVPFSPEELLARALAVSRRSSGLRGTLVPTINMGDITIDILHREVRAGTSVIHLTVLEQSLLYVLASRAGRPVSRNEILDAVWGPDFLAESNIVDRHVRSLRIKLGDDFRNPRFIATDPGKGYRFLPTFSNTGWTGRTEADG
jgi:two-component system KDP operon response regulator KdpE